MDERYFTLDTQDTVARLQRQTLTKIVFFQRVETEMSKHWV